MIDLKQWQQNIIKQMNSSQEKNERWQQQLLPFMEQLAPVIEAIEEKLAAGATEVAGQVERTVCTCAHRLGELPKGLAWMLDDLFFDYYPVNQATGMLDLAKLLQQLKKAVESPLQTSVWLEAGICYGDTSILEKQQVTIVLQNGAKQETLTGRYVRYPGALEVIERLLRHSVQYKEPIPFVVNYYASRFYVLQVDVPKESTIRTWHEIEEVSSLPMAPEIAQQVSWHSQELPSWNVRVRQLKERRGQKKRVLNGLIRRNYFCPQTVPVLPIIPSTGQLIANTYDPENRQYVMTVELSEMDDALFGYTFEPVMEAEGMLSNAVAAETIFMRAEEPTMLDFQQLASHYQFTAPLRLERAELKVLPAVAGSLVRKDCIVLSVSDEADLYSAARMQAFAQLVMQLWPYAKCEVKRAGESDE